MQCRDAQEALTALVDGEPAPRHLQDAAAHAASCPMCAEWAREYRQIGDQLRAGGRVAMPPGLEAKVRAKLAAEGRSANDNMRFEWRQAARQAAMLAIVAGLSGLLGWQLSESAAQREILVRDIVAAHARSLLQENTVQIASSESHTVKPWFNGRLEFAPSVKDLTGEGFPLLGGRLDLIRGQRTATLVYKRRQHVINVFVWPAQSNETVAATPSTLQGYNAITWATGGLTYWAVSDLNAKELAQLQSLL